MDRTCSTGASGSILDCPICKEVYDDPRILPCQHTICEKCLSSYIRQVTQNGGKPLREFPCPVCERKTNLRDSSAFQRNLTIIALLDSKLLKSRIQKASSKKKSRTVTVETQTSLDESVTDSTEILQIQESTTLSRCDTKNADIGCEYASPSLAPKKRKKPRENNVLNQRTGDATKENGDKFEIHVPMTTTYFFAVLLGNPMDVFSLLFFLFVYDIVLIAVIYCLPVLGIVFTADFLRIYSHTSNTLHNFFLFHMEDRKWWHGFLLTNIELMINTTKSLINYTILALLLIPSYTFWSAISDRQSMFTLDVLLQNFVSMFSYSASIVDDINQTLTDLISKCLHQFM